MQAGMHSIVCSTTPAETGQVLLVHAWNTAEQAFFEYNALF